MFLIEYGSKRKGACWIIKPASVESTKEAEEKQYIDLEDKPVWEAGPLDDQHIEWQPNLFNDRMNHLKYKAAAFICEKRSYGGGVWPLQCDNKNLFKDEIQEWMATLTFNKYSKPQQMKLSGTVNGIDVEMSFDTLRKLAKYDSLPTRDYMIPSLDDLLLKPEAHPRWNDMLEALLLPGTYHGTLYRKNLKIEAKLLLMICIYNVILQRGDKQEVRFPEVPIRYSLLNGSPRFPFWYLVMNNVWICRKKAITPEEKGAMKRHRSFDIRRMGTGWTYDKSERYHKLKSEGQRSHELKVDARALLPGEEDEPKRDDEPRSGDDDYADEPHMEHMNVDQGGPSRGHVVGGGFFDYTEPCKRLLKINVHHQRYLILGRGPSEHSLIIKLG
ncbi:hypothetical protein Hanom_Chr09g00764341 [Helianthus anomalus]